MVAKDIKVMISSDLKMMNPGEADYITVTDLARFLGLSIGKPFSLAI